MRCDFPLVKQVRYERFGKKSKEIWLVHEDWEKNWDNKNKRILEGEPCCLDMIL